MLIRSTTPETSSRLDPFPLTHPLLIYSACFFTFNQPGIYNDFKLTNQQLTRYALTYTINEQCAGAMNAELAQQYANTFGGLTQIARNVVRDLDPSVSV